MVPAEDPKVEHIGTKQCLVDWLYNESMFFKSNGRSLDGVLQYLLNWFGKSKPYCSLDINPILQSNKSSNFTNIRKISPNFYEHSPKRFILGNLEGSICHYEESSLLIKNILLKPKYSQICNQRIYKCAIWLTYSFFLITNSLKLTTLYVDCIAFCLSSTNKKEVNGYKGI